MVTLHSGIDLVDITRLEGLKPEIRIRFIKRVFTPGEQEETDQHLNRLMGKFAVKEAVAKADAEAAVKKLVEAGAKAELK